MDDSLMEKVRQALKAKGKVTLLGSKNVNTVKDSK